MKLALVTASTDLDRSCAIRTGWRAQAGVEVQAYTVVNGHRGPLTGWQTAPNGLYDYHHEILGVVPAFARGVAKALDDGADIIACLHDDLDIYEGNWGRQVVNWFEQHPKCGLLGFGGGRGLGAADIYQTPYNPMQLARQDFVSNMRDAEAHGRRVQVPMRVACLDGFSQVGRRQFWQGRVNPFAGITIPFDYKAQELFSIMQEWGIVHHAYDAALGAFAARLGWEVWYLPIACHHSGGVTAVGDARYAHWAKQQNAEGDAGFWKVAHRIVYDQFRDVLPVRVPMGVAGGDY